MDYAERLTVPLRWWAQGTMLVASLWLAVVVAVPDHESVAWAAGGVALALMVALFVGYGSARITVAGGHLTAGRARIPLEHVGSATALDAEGLRRLAGVEADARAHLLLRPYLKRGVRVEVTDPADPTPYWLLSCRRPGQLVAAIEGARVR
ncbi:DUF3093 domain-containing protein [Nocardioides seonyuensis]|uniref:DUF3093 domain-containing protein n=1 Tax=Nocardioides seonyuensis TaxID=2518371 RepID=UPI001FC97A45|nr:DUF3093 domain-containing protein [Nocardioides seonyuensis]